MCCASTERPKVSTKMRVPIGAFGRPNSRSPRLFRSVRSFCISEKVDGLTLQDADAATVERLLKPTLQAWSAISRADVTQTNGYGDFDRSGHGWFPSWHHYLLSILDPQHYDWDRMMSSLDRALIHQLIQTFQPLVPDCPDERRLVHGDFGSNNVLTDAQRITAVLDWQNAKYGDPLFDIATAYFWRTWLPCMQTFATYADRRLNHLPHYRERLWCYQLWIGLDEIYGHAVNGNTMMLAWAQARCREILDEMKGR